MSGLIDVDLEGTFLAVSGVKNQELKQQLCGLRLAERQSSLKKQDGGLVATLRGESMQRTDI